MVVCQECRIQLDSCHRFRTLALEAQKALKGFLQYATNLSGDPDVSQILNLI